MMASRQSSRCGDICGICIDTLTDARELNCTHQFCLVCLTRHIDFARQDYGTSFKCPLCRREYVLNGERTSENIAKSFCRKIQRGALNDSSRHRMAFTRDVITNDNNTAIENGTISRNGRQRQFTLTRLQNQRLNIDRRMGNNSTNYCLDFDNVCLPSINGSYMAQAPVLRHNSTPDSGSLDDEFVIPNSPDSGSLDDQFCFPMSPDELEVNNVPLFTNFPNYFQSYNSLTNQNRISAQFNSFEARGIPVQYNQFETGGEPAQYNAFEPRGINIKNFNIRNNIVQGSTPGQTPSRISGPTTENGLNRNRLPPVLPVQRQSNDASMMKLEMSQDMEQDAINLRSTQRISFMITRI